MTEPKSPREMRREEIMQVWDKWRAYIANGGGGSWPRDAFESLLDEFEDHAAERESEIERLSYLLSCIADHATGGMLSKTNYDKTIYYDYIDDHVERCAQDAVKEALEEKQDHLSSRPATEGKGDD